MSGESQILAIDPGNVQSGFVITNIDTYEPIRFGKVSNEAILDVIDEGSSVQTFIEQIGHYGTGMPAGTTVFDTCRWIGRFEQRVEDNTGNPPVLVKRGIVKVHLTGQAKAKDANVIQALIDRFAPDTPNRGKGSKAEPGFFYGFKADVWQSYALSVYAIDTMKVAGMW